MDQEPNVIIHGPTRLKVLQVGPNDDECRYAINQEYYMYT